MEESSAAAVSGKPMKAFDLTPPITERLAVFPGDVGFKRDIAMDYSKGDHLLLSSFRASFHLGAHADSSSHYHQQGEGIERRNLQSYVGRTQVIRVHVGPNERVMPRHLGSTLIEASRVLFATGTFPDPNHWNSDFASLSPELIFFLAERGVKLVGIDTPSVDPEQSKALESHQALFKTKMAVLEGIWLKDVPEGLYTLMALPLPFVQSDASPVRALLLEDANLFPETPWDFQAFRK